MAVWRKWFVMMLTDNILKMSKYFILNDVLGTTQKNVESKSLLHKCAELRENA